MTAEPVVLACEGVSFRYGRRRPLVLDDVTLQLQSGVTGLLGPNGAGKSTLFSLLTTLRAPTGGVVSVDGVVVAPATRGSIRQLIGYLPQRFDLLPRAGAVRNVAYAAWAHGVPAERCHDAAMAALALVDLTDRADDRVAQLSGGQRQRVGIACAIAHQPRLVILDEPTVGLDPAQRVQVREYLSRLAETATVVVSTHIVEDLVQIDCRVAVINNGRMVFTGSITDLNELGSGTTLQGVSAAEAGYLRLLDPRGIGPEAGAP